MDVITTHVNADFDCLGAMVAASKLYPEACLVFSGSQEKSMRDFFLKSTGYALNFTRLKELDFSQVTRLILVDCQHSARIGKFADILNRPGLIVHIYDHHPEASGDITPKGGIIRGCGSSTTILSMLLQEQGITVNSMEATLMMLGIYEDTGSLTFPSTTVDDYKAASWLLQQGANLNTVADFITQELTAEQISLLNDLLKSLKTTNLNGVEISIAHTAVDYYIGDIAVLAHMMRDMENLEALFLVVGMGNRIYIVARSRISEVNVGDILREFGGGGHLTAASATVKDLTIFQVLAKLEEVLRNKVNPRQVARNIMSAPVISITSSVSMEEARELLTRYNVNAMPVLDMGQMVGIISRRIVEQALYHNLGSVPVSDYMHTEFLRANIDTPIAVIQDYFVSQNRRLVPIFDQDELIGVVTRTDLLRFMHTGEALYDLARENMPVRCRDLERMMTRQLKTHIVQILKGLGSIGSELDMPIYAVGGFVRDLLLGIENFDIDVTIEGDGIYFAELFAKRFGCRCKSHAKFGTAVLVFPDGFKIDVASTRLEYYESPGALPTVERSSLKMDLYRRDFTINTFAIQLNSSDFGRLVDYFGAHRDLKDKVIRVLHNLSFVEDPTRVFRAIRFEQRLRFRIAKHTENLIKNAVKMDFLDKLGGKRLLAELVHILQEKEPLLAIDRMAGFGLLRYIHSDIKMTSTLRNLLVKTQSIVSWYELLFLDNKCIIWPVFFLSLCDSLDHEQFMNTCTRLAVSEHYKQKLAEMRRYGMEVVNYLHVVVKRRKVLSRSDIYDLLYKLPVELLLYLMARTDNELVKRYMSLYFTQLQGVRIQITGDDLVALGIKTGPQIGKLLDKVLHAKLNNLVQSRDDELRYAKDISKKL